MQWASINKSFRIFHIWQLEMPIKLCMSNRLERFQKNVLIINKALLPTRKLSIFLLCRFFLPKHVLERGVVEEYTVYTY